MTGDRRFDYVTIDDQRAMREATRHVLGLGHRKLLFIVRDARLPTTQQRIEGFFASARAATPKATATVLQRDPAEEAFARQVADAMGRPHTPTAIIASNSAIALSLVRVLQELRIRWPDDVSLLAFDEPEWAPILSPPLAVVRHPTERIARETWQRLLARIRTPEQKPRRITLQAFLVPAASLAPPRRPGKR